MLGGMMTAIEDAAATTPCANGSENFSRSIMAGIRITPSAATVAAPEPEIAPKKQATTMQTIAMPPRRCPSRASMNAISRSEMPALAMMLPERTKNGTASSRYLPMPP